MARIEGIQKHMGTFVSNGLIKLERQLREELDETLHQEEMKWFQKSKEDWISSSNLNTQFYHATTVVRRNRNKILGLKNNDEEWIQDKRQIETLIQEYYKSLYSRKVGRETAETETGHFPRIEDEQWIVMNRKVTREEVKDAGHGSAQGTRSGRLPSNVL